MKLSQAQLDLLEQVGLADPENGLSADEASAKRVEDGYFNTVDPPINCPGWLCIVLPCIKHVPSMKIFAQIKPEDAEVKRDGRWIRYDASSLVAGDVIRLEEGDGIPADCVILQLEEGCDEMLVDHRYVTGEDKPRSCTHRSDGTAKPIQLFWGGQVVQGSALAVVTATGPKTMVASMIRDKRFPPTVGDVLAANIGADDDEEQGVSLIQRDNEDRRMA
jgi:hypothetical protein